VSEWILQYWTEQPEKHCLERWFNSLTAEQFKSISQELELLKRCGNELKLPHSKALTKGLFELREKDFGYRIYYGFLPNKTIVLLQTGNKSTQIKDIKLAYLKLKKLYREIQNET